MEPDFRVAPGGIITVQGSGLATGMRNALVPPLPTGLAGTQVFIDGLKCPLLFVSPEIVQAQVPFNLTTTHPTGSVYLAVTESVAAGTEVFIGQAKAQLLSATLAPGLAGVYQLRIQVPAGAGQSIRLVTEGAREHAAEWPAAMPGTEKFTGLSAQIEAPFPTLAAPATWSPIPVGARLSLSMTITPQPEPFDVALNADAAAIRITVKPAEGVFEGTAVVPLVPTRFGDFSAADLRVVDRAANGMSMPGNIVPASRIPLEYAAAMRNLPQPDTPLPGGANGTVRFRGTIPDNRRLVIDPSTVPALATAMAWKAVPDLQMKLYTATFRLTVDGDEVAAKEVAIPVQ